MIKITKDGALTTIANYLDCAIDYCLISDNDYHGLSSHQEAVIMALKAWGKKEKMKFTYNKQQMKATKINQDFFKANNQQKTSNSESYSSLFLNTPYGSPSRKRVFKNNQTETLYEKYTIDDFNYINSLLFPNGYSHLEIFNWSTNWSNYFDDGLEWWGAMLVSVYDCENHRFVIIGASKTD